MAILRHLLKYTGRNAAVLILMVASNCAIYAQSTYASLVGTVRDPSGAGVPASIITIENTGTSAKRSSITDQSGSYTVPNLEPGMYKVTIQASGFVESNYSVELLARQTVRIDGDMQIAAQAQSVNVTAEATSVISAEVSNIAETKTGRELVDLPVAITSRSGGSTSPLATLTTQPGVQTDASGNISVAGAKPSMLSVSIDGISSTGPRSAAPLAELFPSFNTIAEIRVSEVNNTAEFGGVSDITTISKSGTNSFHGGLFENLQNTAMNASNLFSHTVPKTIMNDYGLYGGGPVILPKLYNGRDKTFFFVAYEGLRLPKESVLVESVPSLALRTGDISALSGTIKDPLSGLPFPGKQIPDTRISPLSRAVLNTFYPLPNTGSPNAIANNYVQSFGEPIVSDQGDARVDRFISDKQNIFGRLTYKKREVTAQPTGSVLIGPSVSPEKDYGVTIAHNYVISPTVINEVRGGLTGITSSKTYGRTTEDFVNSLGLTGLPQPYPLGTATPNFTITGFQGTGANASSFTTQRTIQILDNLTLTRGKHSVKFGGDFRYSNGLSTNVYASLRLGQYTFDNSTTRILIGNAYAAFLLGVPDQTRLNTVRQPDSDGYVKNYAFYTQDDWKVTSRLTINYGLRWEYHPMFEDHLLNGTNFLLDTSNFIDGKQVNGTVIISNQKAFGILNPDFADSIAPVPIVTAGSQGIPESLRYSVKTDFAPRVGFAWRTSASGKTVIRGGYGRFIQTPGGALIGAGFAIHSANQAIYNQSIVDGKPTLTFPYPFPAKLAQPGTQFFQQAADIHYKDPTVDQWNLTVEREPGFGSAIRLSYSGSFANNLNRQGNPDQLAPNTVGFTAGSPLLKYPQFGYVRLQTNGGVARYHSFTAVGTKRLSRGIQFQSSYTFTRNLTDAQGYNPTAFAGESGGVVTDLRNPHLDYGNVSYTRRYRYLTTFLYQVPFGKQGTLLKNANRAVDALVGGWEFAGVLLFQTGPFLTVTTSGADPSGTGFPQLVGNGRADVVNGVSPYVDNPTPQRWLNPAAYAVPTTNIGRYPTSPVGAITGPGTEALSLSLTKSVVLREGLRLQLGGQAANFLNHPNYAPPNTTFNTAAFGTITALQSAEGAGPRQLQITARITF